MRGLRIPGTPIRTFRLRVFLFGVVEVSYSVGEPMTPEELADAHSFFNYPPDRYATSVSHLLSLCFRKKGELRTARSYTSKACAPLSLHAELHYIMV